jgi:hypothetical protein
VRVGQVKIRNDGHWMLHDGMKSKVKNTASFQQGHAETGYRPSMAFFVCVRGGTALTDSVLQPHRTKCVGVTIDVESE